MSAIAARDLRLAMGGRAILDGVSLELRPGEVLCVIGANGAGKSTLLGLLSGARRPDAGMLTGPVADARAPAAMARVRAVLPQSVELGFAFNAFELVRLGAEAGGARAEAVASLCHDALAEVGLDGFAGRNVAAMSGGEAQRVHLARALAQVRAMPGPHRFLLLDEPTASLDLKHQILTLDIARRLARTGVGVLAILHDLNLACLAADLILALAGGRVVAQGRPEEVVTDGVVEATYGLRLPVGRVPATAPFLLPQIAKE